MGLNSPNTHTRTSCETPKEIQCCKMSIPLGVRLTGSIILQGMVEKWEEGVV